MRKYVISTSRFATEPTSENPRKFTLNQKSSFYGVDKLALFHEELNFKQKVYLSTRTKSLVKPTYGSEKTERKEIHKDLKRVGQQLQQIRREFTSMRSDLKSERQNDKLYKFVHLLESSLEERRQERFHPQVQPQVFYPVIMPFPTGTRNQSRNETFYKKSERQTMRERQVARIKKTRKKLLKVVNCILFTIYLRQYCKRMRQQRKSAFDELLPSLQSYLKSFAFDIKKLLRPVYSILLVKRQVSYDIQEDQNRMIINRKVESIRKLVFMVIQTAKKWMQLAVANKKQLDILYHLCRHGNYSCTAPILTPDQLQLTCISSKFKFVSADCNLQKAAFINLFFIKILIYNGLLSPQTVVSQFLDDVFQSNLQVIASVLYELVLSVQDQYMLLVPKTYKIGNFTKMKRIQMCSPLCYKNALKTEGDLISGLKEQTWTTKYFNLESWNLQKKCLRQTVSMFHTAMAKHHQSLAERCF